MFDDMTTIMKEDNTLCVAMDAKMKKTKQNTKTQKNYNFGVCKLRYTTNPN